MAFQTTGFGVDLWRFIAGIGIGLELVTIDTYLSELVPRTRPRPRLCLHPGHRAPRLPVVAFLAWQLTPTAPFGFDGWRWVVVIGSVGAIVVWWIRLGLPESPRWLAQPRAGSDEAERVMAQIEAAVRGRVRAAAAAGRARRMPGDAGEGSIAEIWQPPYRKRDDHAVAVQLLPDGRVLRLRRLDADAADRQGHPRHQSLRIQHYHRHRRRWSRSSSCCSPTGWNANGRSACAASALACSACCSPRDRARR